MAEAAWCSIKDLLDYLINDQQKRKLTSYQILLLHNIEIKHPFIC
jgi:hypothetical protein